MCLSFDTFRNKHGPKTAVMPLYFFVLICALFFCASLSNFLLVACSGIIGFFFVYYRGLSVCADVKRNYEDEERIFIGAERKAIFFAEYFGLYGIKYALRK